jgi:hypothetical protein
MIATVGAPILGKIPAVATTTPSGPPVRYPTNVAVVKTRPGVNRPTAMASRICGPL